MDKKSRYIYLLSSYLLMFYNQSQPSITYVKVCKFTCDINGGPNEDRTRYLFVANEALSQMSYGPKAFLILLKLDSKYKYY